jgi:hypothetical protein
MAEANVICMKWGRAFGPEYINRLYRGVREHLVGDLRFFCLTDDRTGIRPEVEIIDYRPGAFEERLAVALPKANRRGPMQKLAMQRPGLVPDLKGPLLALDIDVVVTGRLDDLFRYRIDKVCMRRAWAPPSRWSGLANGSACRFDPALHSYLYDNIARDTENCVLASNGSEQSYVSWTAYEHGDLEFFPDTWCASFKYDCRPPRPLNLILRPRLPPDARLVFFHGRPKMAEAVAGYWPNPLHATRPAPWLTEAWQDD